MFEIKDITLADKPLFDSYFKDKPCNAADFCFSYLFMWRLSFSLKYAIIDDSLCIFTRHGHEAMTVLFPIDGDRVSATNKLLAYFDEMGQNPIFRLYCNKDVNLLESISPNKFIITEDIFGEDYIYNASDLINLSGKKYHSKRNHINKFKSLYNYEYKPITDENIDECIKIYDLWCDAKDPNLKYIDEATIASYELLNNFTALNLKGGMLYVNSTPVAFTVGEPLNNDTALIHLEFADTNYEGAFTMINQQFAENEWKSFKYINREEDMGLEGLKKAKMSYYPVMMVEKFIATLNY